MNIRIIWNFLENMLCAGIKTLNNHLHIMYRYVISDKMTMTPYIYRTDAKSVYSKYSVDFLSATIY